MIYNGINLTNIVQDTKTFKRWSLSERAYELFSKTLDKNQQTITITDPDNSYGWFELVFHKNHPSELFLIINVNWSETDWLTVTSLKDKYSSVGNRNSTKSKFINSGIVEVPDDEQRLVDQQRFLRALRDNRGMLSKAVQYSGVSMKTYKQWIATDLVFKELVSETAEAVKDDLEFSLMGEALDGDVNALKLALSAKAKDRGYGKHEAVVQEAKQEVDLSLLSLQEQQQLAKLLKKAQPKQLEMN